MHFFSFFFMFWPHQAACGILMPQPGIEPVPPASEGRILTTGLPGKSQKNVHSSRLPRWLCGKLSAFSLGDPGLIPGSGRSLGEGNGSPLQYSCLENPMDRGAWLGYSPWGHKEWESSVQFSSVQSLSHVRLFVTP